MFELFGLGLVGTIALLAVAGVWLILGLIFGINGVVEKRKKYNMGTYAGGFIRRWFSYTVSLVLGIVLAPLLVVFWLGKRAGRRQS